MKSLYAIVIFSLSVILSGCSPVTVNYDYDTSFDFSTLKSYRWLDVPADFPANEITIGRIKNAVDQQLKSKGFGQVSAAPDFLISMLGFKDIIREGVVTGSPYTGYTGYRGYGGPGRYGDYERRFQVYEFEEGTLTLTFINAARNALIWEGTATVTIEPNSSTESKEKKTQETIAKLLANFPPIQ